MKILVLSFLVLISGLSFSGDQPNWEFTEVANNAKLCEGCNTPKGVGFGRFAVDGEVVVNYMGNTLRLFDLEGIDGAHILDIMMADREFNDLEGLTTKLKGSSSVSFFVKREAKIFDLVLGGETHEEYGLLTPSGKSYFSVSTLVYVSIDGGKLKKLSEL